jgi:histidyl-tRNA synthetase
MRWLDQVRSTFESYGFTSVETPSAEALDVLMSKGETSQEVYTLSRFQADGTDDSDARIGLRFDLTVPFARYTAQNFNELDFPFRRYQIGRVWRGERPQAGRYREFTQCDIDVISLDSVPLTVDAEMPRIAADVLTRLCIGPFQILVNNRKVLEGFYRGLGITDPVAVIRAVDKRDKIGPVGVRPLLVDLGLTPAQTDAVLDLAALRGSGTDVVAAVRAFGVTDPMLTEGLDELTFVLNSLTDLEPGTVIADLSIARGLDYYTGTVYEGKFVDYPDYGSICSGGRYENLAGSFIRRNLPGVGISIGLTRIFAKMLAEGRITGGPKTPTQVLVAVPSADSMPEAIRTGATLRARGMNVEVYLAADKLAKQLRYAARKGIPYVWFPPFRDGAPDEVKSMATGDQVPADPQMWTIPADTSTDLL